MAEAAVDLRADLGAQFDAAETGGGDGTSTTGAGSSESSSDGAGNAETQRAENQESAGGENRDRDPATGRFIERTSDAPQGNAAGEQQATQQTTQDGTQQTQQPATQQQAPQVDLPPTTWTPAAKAVYVKAASGQPLTAEEAKTLVAEQRKRESDFANGIRQYSEAAGNWSRMNAIAQPYEPMLRAAGGFDKVVADLLNTNYRLITSTPQERGQLLMDVARRFGADLTAFGGQQQQTQQGQPQGIDAQTIQRMVQEQLNPHVQRFDQFQTQYQTAQQRAEQQQQQELNGQIQAFQNATDPTTGQPKHIYFENVRGPMAALLGSGDAKSLEDAYEMACRAHPEVSKLVFAAQRQREDSERLKATQRAAEDARRATQANVTGQGAVGMADSSKRSLRDDLAAAWDGGGRV